MEPSDSQAAAARPANPGTIDTTIQALRALQNHLGDSRGLPEADTRHNALLNRCGDPARPQL
jgi:hypothetical protein